MPSEADDKADGLSRALADAFSGDPGDVDSAMVRLMLELSQEDSSASAAQHQPAGQQKTYSIVFAQQWAATGRAPAKPKKLENRKMESHGPFAEAKKLIAKHGRHVRQTLVDRIVVAVRAGDDVEAKNQGDLLRQVDAELDSQTRFGVKPADR